MKNLAVFCLIAATVSGCSLVGSNPSPPTAFEKQFADVVTNYVIRTVYATNMAVITNTVTVTQTNLVNFTNIIGQVIQQPVITTVPVSTSIVTNWNVVGMTITNEHYTFTQNAGADALKGGVAAGVNLISPGAGGLAGTIAGAILSGWFWLRGNKFRGAGNTLAQNIEMGRELLKSVQGGAPLEKQWLSTMIDQQQSDGTKGTVEGIVKSPAVSNSKAQSDAQGIVAKVTVANTPTPPAAAPKLG